MVAVCDKLKFSLWFLCKCTDAQHPKCQKLFHVFIKGLMDQNVWDTWFKVQISRTTNTENHVVIGIRFTEQ